MEDDYIDPRLTLKRWISPTVKWYSPKRLAYWLGEKAYCAQQDLLLLRNNIIALLAPEKYQAILEEGYQAQAVAENHHIECRKCCSKGQLVNAQSWINRAEKMTPQNPTVDEMKMFLNWTKGNNETALDNAEDALQKCTGLVYGSHKKFSMVAYYWALEKAGYKKDAQKIFNRGHRKYELWDGLVDSFLDVDSNPCLANTKLRFPPPPEL